MTTQRYDNDIIKYDVLTMYIELIKLSKNVVSSYRRVVVSLLKMIRLKVNQYPIFMLSAILWLAIDLGVKNYVSKTDINSIIFIKNFFYLYLQTNKGVAFGINLGYAFQLIVSVVIVGLLLYFGFKYILPIKKHTFINQFLLGIIIGGAAGNLINRFMLGYVIDYIVLKPLPVFNIADIGITIGLIALFILTYNINNKEI